MGLHNFYMESFASKKSEPEESSIFRTDVNGGFLGGDVSNIVKYADRHIYRKTTSCRESLMIYLTYMSALFSKYPKNNIITGIRCFGEQYSTVAILMESKEESSKRLSEFFSKILGFKVTVKASGVTEQYPVDQYPNKIISLPYLGKNGETLNKDASHYITLYIKSWENPEALVGTALNISATLGVLREPSIIREILSGKIATINSLAKALANLAVSRCRGQDKSYFIVGLTNDYSSKTLQQMFPRIREYLHGEINGDGCDYLSIFYLAVFFYYKKLNTFQTHFGSGCSGPVSYARYVVGSRVHIDELSDYFGLGDKEEILRNKIKNSYYVTNVREITPEKILLEVLNGKSKEETKKIS